MRPPLLTPLAHGVGQERALYARDGIEWAMEGMVLNTDVIQLIGATQGHNLPHTVCTVHH